MPGDLPDLTFDFPSAGVLAADAAFWQLYDSAFPANEREPRRVILETLGQGVGFAVRARANDSTVGLGSAHLLWDPPVLFVLYLAVTPDLRSRRIGEALFEKIWTKGAERYAERGLVPAGMVWEVEMPERATSEQDREPRRRRIAFFSRVGGHVLPKRYIQPPVDGIAAVPMHLMFRPVPAVTLPDDPAVSALVHAIYFEKYHQMNKIPKAVLQDLLRETGAGPTVPSKVRT